MSSFPVIKHVGLFATKRTTNDFVIGESVVATGHPDKGVGRVLAITGKTVIVEWPDGAVEEIQPFWLDGTAESKEAKTVYHGTTQQKAQEILDSGVLHSPSGTSDEYGVYVTTDPSAGGYGDGSVLKLDIDEQDLILDDEFPDGRQDFMIRTTNNTYRPDSIEKHSKQHIPVSKLNYEDFYISANGMA